MYDKRPPLIAKSPSSGSEGGTSRGGGRGLLLLAANLQAASGLLMVVLGVLCAAYGSSLSRLGAGLWGGLVALGAGALGSLAALRPRLLFHTLHLAVSLVSLATSTLALLLTLTAALRDANPPPDQQTLQRFTLNESSTVNVTSERSRGRTCDVPRVTWVTAGTRERARTKIARTLR